jgi:hypothetical protein
MCVKSAVLILVGSREGRSRRLTTCRARDGHRNLLQGGKFEHKNGMHPSIQPQIYCRLDAIDRTHLQNEEVYQLGYLQELCDRVLTLVMSVEAAGVEDQRRVGIHINAGVCVPQISVYKRWFDRSALALKRAKKTRDDLVKEYWDQDIELGIVSLCLEFEFESLPHALRKESFPALLPLGHLG